MEVEASMEGVLEEISACEAQFLHEQMNSGLCMDNSCLFIFKVSFAKIFILLSFTDYLVIVVLFFDLPSSKNLHLTVL